MGIYDEALKSITQSTASSRTRTRTGQQNFSNILDLIDQETIDNALANMGGSDNIGNSVPNTTSSGGPPVGKKSAFNKFVESIAKQESGGNYQAVNKTSGALGKYQVMPANVPSWSKQALGVSLTPQQFLKSPGYQDRVAKSKLQYYFNKYGAAGAAKAWYGGESAARKTSNVKQGAYPSINKYAKSIVSRLG